MIDIIIELVGGPRDGERLAVTADQLHRGVIDFAVMPATIGILEVDETRPAPPLMKITYKRRERINPDIGLALMLWHFDLT